MGWDAVDAVTVGLLWRRRGESNEWGYRLDSRVSAWSVFHV